ncbi:MAG: arsenosugar biosynthesis radical SAM protein ArsS [Mariprofundaceae bacterium]
MSSANINAMQLTCDTLSFGERAGILSRLTLDCLQINLGKLCNQACTHCHVEASPKRTEIMTGDTQAHILAWLDDNPVSTVDLTGGAPEMNPGFRPFVEALRARDIHVMDRCNLTVLLLQDQQDTAEFLARHGVEVVASLPCYLQQNVDSQRGRGVFNGSIQGLKKLNALGYGQADPRLKLNLVYNPAGPFLPPPQETLEADYRARLLDDHGIVFNELFCLTNIPIKRYAEWLERQNELENYQRLLEDNFNSTTLPYLMCRNLISIDWQGFIFDCDFNQMLDMPATGLAKRRLWEVPTRDLIDRRIATAKHCYGCTAGSGSSCGGALAE